MHYEKEIENLLLKHNVILKGHFLLSSGYHSNIYFEKYRILENPYLLSILVKNKISDLKNLGAECVAGPFSGGIIVAYEVARQLNVYACYGEKFGGKIVFRRGFDLSGKKVLIVDDVLTTGISIKKTIEGVREKGGNPIGIFVLINRSPIGINLNFNIPLIFSYKKEIAIYKPEDCPLCKKGVPLEIRGGKIS